MSYCKKSILSDLEIESRLAVLDCQPLRPNKLDIKGIEDKILQRRKRRIQYRLASLTLAMGCAICLLNNVSFTEHLPPPNFAQTNTSVSITIPIEVPQSVSPTAELGQLNADLREMQLETKLLLQQIELNEMNERVRQSTFAYANAIRHKARVELLLSKFPNP